jgi:hypothetical protein
MVFRRCHPVADLLLTRPDHLEPGEREQLAGVRAGCPHFDALAWHINAVAETMTGLTGGAALDPWLAAAVAADLPEPSRIPAASPAHHPASTVTGTTNSRKSL